MISKSKIKESFSVCQFKIDGFNTPFGVDRDHKGSGIILHFREDLPAKLLSIERTNESCFVELDLKCTKWLISYSYNPNKCNIYSHLKSLSRNLDLFPSKQDNFLVVDEFNVSTEEDFCERFSLKNLIKDPTCYKNPNNPSYINLMFTNKARWFQRSCVIETDLSDFHKTTITVLKIQCSKLEPKVASYRNYKISSDNIFLKSVNSKLSKYSFSPDENGFDRFCQICTETLNKYPPRKKNNKGKLQSFYI